MENDGHFNYYQEIYSIVERKNLDETQKNLFTLLDTDSSLEFLNFCNTTTKINFFFNLLISSKSDKIKSYLKNYIENKSLKGNRNQMEIVIICLIIGTYDFNSKNKPEFIDYLSIILGLDKSIFEQNYDNFVKNFNYILMFTNIYSTGTKLVSIHDTVRDLNIQLHILEEFSKQYLYYSDNVMIIILVKYVKVILRLYLSKVSSYEKNSEKPLLYIMVKYCFLNKFEILDYSLDLINFLLEKFIENNIATPHLSRLFFINFTPNFMMKLIELDNIDISKKENELIKEFVSQPTAENSISYLFSKDICIFYFVYLYNNKTQNIIKQKETKETEAKNYINFPALFYMNFKLYDMYEFILKNQQSIQTKDNLSKSVVNLTLLMYSEIMKFNLPLDFPNNIIRSETLLSKDNYELESISKILSSLECQYISNRIFKIIVFRFLIK